MTQQKIIFSPIAVVCETSEDAEALWELVRFAGLPGEPLSNAARRMANKISDWFSNEAQLGGS